MAVTVRPSSKPKRKDSAPVPEQLVLILRDLRSENLPFELAWAEAHNLVSWPRSQRETKAWREVLADTEHAWRARYEGWEPLPAEVAAGALYDVLRARSGEPQ